MTASCLRGITCYERHDLEIPCDTTGVDECVNRQQYLLNFLGTSVEQTPCTGNDRNTKIVELCTSHHSVLHSDEIHALEDTPSLVQRLFFQDSLESPLVSESTKVLYFRKTTFKSKTTDFACNIFYFMNLYTFYFSTIGHYWKSITTNQHPYFNCGNN